MPATSIHVDASRATSVRLRAVRRSRLAIAAGLVVVLVAAFAPATLAKPVGPPPDIASISPESGGRGTVVTVTGRDFGGPKTRIWVGDVVAVVRSSTGSRATFEVPASAPTGRTTVRLVNPSGQSDAIPFAVEWDGSMAVARDVSAAVSATIGRAGGSLVSGAMRLDIPAGALSDDVAITMTPLTGAAGTPFASTFLGGAHFAPEGLAFLAPARLSLPLPAGVPAADVLGFASTGSGANVHLVPRDLAGDRIVIPVWHFSTNSASSAGADGVAAMGATAPTGAESAALHAIALADAACALEQAQGADGGPACEVQDDIWSRALLDWYAGSVEPGLRGAIGQSYEAISRAFADWLRWESQGHLAATWVSDLLVTQRANARSLAVAALADIAERRLDECTGADLVAEVRGVARLADLALAGAIGEALGDGLPSAANGEIVDACASIEIDEVELPAVVARGTDRNTLSGRASLDVWNGPNRTDLSVSLELDVDGGGTETTPTAGADGRFDVPVYVVPGVDRVQVTITARAASDDLIGLGLDSATTTATRPARDRLEWLTGDVTVDAGEGADLAARLAGDDIAGQTIGFSTTGPGTLSVLTDATGPDGTASTRYTASGGSGTATVTATFVDGNDTRSRSITITTAAEVAVDIDPDTVTLQAGAEQRFTATVSGAQDDAVAWSATCGSVDADGDYTAPSTAGTCTVTATSVEASGTSASAVVTVEAAPISVTVTPATVTLAPGATQQFLATVTGTTDQAVTWTASGGTIDPQGRFTAGATAGTSFTVTATSDASGANGAWGSAAVTIATPPSLVLAPERTSQSGADAFARASDFGGTHPSTGDCASGFYESRVAIGESGTFDCAASNDFGEHVSASTSVSTGLATSGLTGSAAATSSMSPSSTWLDGSAHAWSQIWFRPSTTVEYSLTTDLASENGCSGGESVAQVVIENWAGSQMPSTGTLIGGALYSIFVEARVSEGDGTDAGTDCSGSATAGFELVISPPDP